MTAKEQALEAENIELTRLVSKQEHKISELETVVSNVLKLIYRSGTLGLRSTLAMIKNEVEK